MQRPGVKCFGAFCGVAILYILLSGLGLRLNGLATPAEPGENAAWVGGSRYWLDRQFCSWVGSCGMMHLRETGWIWEQLKDEVPNMPPDLAPFWTSSKENPDSWSQDERQLREIPQYVFDHAPYVHLFSGEDFWPSDVAEHLTHVSPRLNWTTMNDMEVDRNLTNLHDLNDVDGGRHGRFMYLSSADNVEEWPSWLTSIHNVPMSPDPRLDIEQQDDDPVGDAPANIDLESAVKQQGSPIGIPYPRLPTDLRPSTNGRCGGNSGFTCVKSKFGNCCSIHGWCGKSDQHCDSYCDPLHGKCADPLHPPQGPKPDLRKHKRDFMKEQDRPSKLGKSKAPAILIVADKGNGTVDAFWFYFYSFNLGQKVLKIRFGNHVGDWENTMIRFKDGKPQAVYLSEHNFGDAYSWSAMEKYVPNPDGSMAATWSNATFHQVAKRPVTYSAVGSHAMYAAPGLHPYILPWGLLHDQTDRGPLWDPAQNVQSYTYDVASQAMRASTRNPFSPTGWLDYAGHWGDKYYPLSDPRQYRLAGQYHYVNGPTGPKFKGLGREKVCRSRGECHIRKWVGEEGDKAQRLIPAEGEEEGGLPGGNSTDDAA
ncbi:hypothetical protein LTR08_000678 [Meristemomyces frigidus]|nr:hypothetical protein LTR08_000678 [Meristemomyces frigidus]